MRVLVTGAAGFIGSTVVDRLRAGGHEVVALDVLLPLAHAGTPDWAVADLVRADVRDPGALEPLLGGVDVVCHQAAMVGLGQDAQDAPDFVAHNVLGTAVLLAAMARAGVRRLVQASSMVVYGDGAYACSLDGAVRPSPRRPADVAAGRFDPRCPRCDGRLEWRPVVETDALDPRTTYAVTKLAQEQLAAAWTTQAGGAAISLRYHNVYGPRMPRDTPYAGVASLFRSANADGRSARVFEDGQQMRDFVHVDDVATANVLALEQLVQSPSDRIGHVAYNIASGDPRPIIDLAVRLAEVMQAPAPSVVGGGRPGDVRHVVASAERAVHGLGFTARVRFDDGVARFATDPMRAPVR